MPDYYGDSDEIVSELTEIKSELEQIHSALLSKSSFSVGGLVWAFLILMFAADWSGSWFDRITDKAWHSFKDDVHFDNITVDKRPYACDFFHAPIGGKGCEYRKQVERFGPKERQALVDAATTQQEKRTLENLPNSVRIYWAKEGD